MVGGGRVEFFASYYFRIGKITDGARFWRSTDCVEWYFPVASGAIFVFDHVKGLDNVCYIERVYYSGRFGFPFILLTF